MYQMKNLQKADGTWNSNILKQEKWLSYLCITKNNAINIERVASVSDITGKETLEYVFRSLSILEGEKTALSPHLYALLKTTLQWSEVAKGGSPSQRKLWLESGLPLDIHNLASAEIYLSESDDTKEDKKIIYTLIQTHGILGQNIRGEVSVCKNRPLLTLASHFTMEEFYTLLVTLNKCIIGAVSMALWDAVSDRITKLVSQIIEGNLAELPVEERIHSLSKNLSDTTDSEIAFFAEKLFPNYELWYFDAALMDFSAEQIVSILKMVGDAPSAANATHITFWPLATSLYYDYEGKKHINIYKKRVIEKYLRDAASGADVSLSENVMLHTELINNTLYVDFQFSKVCEKLIEFCVEAERSGLLTYEKSITILFDMFGFRKDEFDRLNNEDKYLQTMNASENSTKTTILDYVTGETVVDVGSGGGVLLDLLEEKYPGKQIIGTDISTNVIETLEQKKQDEGHHWDVVKHNFADGPFTERKADTVIFSSILHEIFSYTDTAEGKFNINSVKLALQNAYASIPSGGRIVIRDGIKTEGHELLTVQFKTPAGLIFFRNYANDFAGLPDIVENRPFSVDNETLTATGDINFMREFLYTYTWGNDSYSHEVQEQFGYFTITEFREFFLSLGARIVEAKEFLEPGYEEHLSPLVNLMDAAGNPAAFPLSNCIVVIEKP